MKIVMIGHGGKAKVKNMSFASGTRTPIIRVPFVSRTHEYRSGNDDDRGTPAFDVIDYIDTGVIDNAGRPVYAATSYEPSEFGADKL